MQWLLLLGTVVSRWGRPIIIAKPSNSSTAAPYVEYEAADAANDASSQAHARKQPSRQTNRWYCRVFPAVGRRGRHGSPGASAPLPPRRSSLLAAAAAEQTSSAKARPSARRTIAHPGSPPVTEALLCLCALFFYLQYLSLFTAVLCVPAHSQNTQVFNHPTDRKVRLTKIIPPFPRRTKY